VSFPHLKLVDCSSGFKYGAKKDSLKWTSLPVPSPMTTQLSPLSSRTSWGPASQLGFCLYKQRSQGMCTTWTRHDPVDKGRKHKSLTSLLSIHRKESTSFLAVHHQRNFMPPVTRWRSWQQSECKPECGLHRVQRVTVWNLNRKKKQDLLQHKSLTHAPPRTKFRLAEDNVAHLFKMSVPLPGPHDAQKLTKGSAPETQVKLQLKSCLFT